MFNLKDIEKKPVLLSIYCLLAYPQFPSLQAAVLTRLLPSLIEMFSQAISSPVSRARLASVLFVFYAV